MGNTISLTMTASPGFRIRREKAAARIIPFYVGGVPHPRDSEKMREVGSTASLEFQVSSTGELPPPGGWLSKQHNCSSHWPWSLHLTLTEPYLGDRGLLLTRPEHDQSQEQCHNSKNKLQGAKEMAQGLRVLVYGTRGSEFESPYPYKKI